MEVSQTSSFDAVFTALVLHRRKRPTSHPCLSIVNKSASLLICCGYILIMALLQARTSEGRRLYGNGSSTSVSTNGQDIAICFFRTGDAARDSKLTPFYVPVSDKYMYEEGVKEYLQKMGASAEQLSVVCEEVKGDANVTCELCLYNEISADQKHVRQGQVLGSMLLQCMRGIFEQSTVMEKAEYHPICYPRPQQRAARSLPARTAQEEITCTGGEPTTAAQQGRSQPQLQHQQIGRACDSAGQNAATDNEARRHS